MNEVLHFEGELTLKSNNGKSIFGIFGISEKTKENMKFLIKSLLLTVISSGEKTREFKENNATFEDLFVKIKKKSEDKKTLKETIRTLGSIMIYSSGNKSRLNPVIQVNKNLDYGYFLICVIQFLINYSIECGFLTGEEQFISEVLKKL